METGVIAKEPTRMNINIDPEALIAKGIESGLSIEGMQKLLDMRMQLKQEYAREEFFKALSKFQKECPVIEKKKTVLDRSGKELYKYAPIEDIISQVSAPLESNGFSFTFKTVQSQGVLTVTCEAHHSAGHTEKTEITVPIGSGGIMSGVQQIGSATTYAKRYSFCNQFGIMTGDEDDDASGDRADKTPAKPAEKKPVKPHGHLDRALPAINAARTAQDIDGIKRKISLSEWTEEESLKLDDALKNAEQRIREGVPA